MSYPTVSYTYHADDGVHYRSFNNNFEDIATIGLSQGIKDIKVSDTVCEDLNLTGQDVTISNAVTAHAKTTIDDITTKILGFGAPAISVVVSNEIQAAQTFLKLMVSGGVADVNTISDNGYFGNGSILILTAMSGNTLTFKHGADNIRLDSATDKVITYKDTLTLIKYAVEGTAQWLQLSYGNNM